MSALLLPYSEMTRFELQGASICLKIPGSGRRRRSRMRCAASAGPEQYAAVRPRRCPSIRPRLQPPYGVPVSPTNRSRCAAVDEAMGGDALCLVGRRGHLFEPSTKHGPDRPVGAKTSSCGCRETGFIRRACAPSVIAEAIVIKSPKNPPASVHARRGSLANLCQKWDAIAI